MREIHLDGSNWKTANDFYDSLFDALSSPSWHGRNFNALTDSITGGQINEVEPPFVLHISGLSGTTRELRPLVEDFIELVKTFRADGCEVDIAVRD